MDKKRAKQILTVHACCTTASVRNYMCLMCPWHNTKDCEETAINEEIIIEAIKVLRGKNMRRMKLSDIKISEEFENTIPSEDKMSECRYNWRMFNKQDRFIVVDHNNILIDGYVMYLILMEHREEYAEVKISNRRKKRWHRKNTEGWTASHYINEPTTYIYGMHYNTIRGEFSKEFVWRVPKSWSEQGWEDGLTVGDEILVDTKYGVKKITVTKVVRLGECPTDVPVRRVVKRLSKTVIKK